MEANPVVFAGAGPGAPDLVTLRCVEALRAADLVIYAGSLVNPEILRHCRQECRLVDSSALDLDEVIDLMEAAVAAGEKVVRLHTGDPAMYGAISEQMNRLDRLGISYTVIPGVSSVFAAAGALQCELTMPGLSQSLILTRTAGRTPMPNRETVKNFAATGATLAFFLSAGKLEELTSELLAAGLAGETPAAVVYRASWENQKIVRGQVADIAEKSAAAGIRRQALLLVGRVLERAGGLSKLYDKHFSHGYRSTREAEFFSGRCALYALSRTGLAKAAEIARALPGAQIFVPERLAPAAPADPAADITVQTFAAGEMGPLVERQWHDFAGHIFISATGIAVRKITGLLKDKTSDPAVVVCDENGAHAISLVGGHIAGANRLARKLAGITGGRAVITTATDIHNLVAFDELASRCGWWVVNPREIKIFNAALLENRRIDLLLPPEVCAAHYGDREHLRPITATDTIAAELVVALDPPPAWKPAAGVRVLRLATAAADQPADGQTESQANG